MEEALQSTVVGWLWLQPQQEVAMWHASCSLNYQALLRQVPDQLSRAHVLLSQCAIMRLLHFVKHHVWPHACNVCTALPWQALPGPFLSNMRRICRAPEVQALPPRPPTNVHFLALCSATLYTLVYVVHICYIIKLASGVQLRDTVTLISLS